MKKRTDYNARNMSERSGLWADHGEEAPVRSECNTGHDGVSGSHEGKRDVTDARAGGAGGEENMRRGVGTGEGDDRRRRGGE